MRSRCLKNLPANEPKIIIETWQVAACDTNTVAAALLSFFEYWHSVKLEMRGKATRLNDVAELHGEVRSQDETLYQFHNEEDLIKGILIAKRDSIRKGITLLKQKGFISVHKNPIARYAFDKTRYFLFHPEAVDEWLAEYRSPLSKDRQSWSKNQQRLLENQQQSLENQPAITDITPDSSSDILPPTPLKGGTDVYVGGESEEKEVSEQPPSTGKGEPIDLAQEAKVTHDDQTPPAGRDNSKQVQKLIKQFEAGEITKLPPFELKMLADAMIGDHLKIYRESGNILCANPNDIDALFLAYVAQNHLSEGFRGDAFGMIRNAEQDPTKWRGLVNKVEAWRKKTQSAVAANLPRAESVRESPSPFGGLRAVIRASNPMLADAREKAIAQAESDSRFVLIRDGNGQVIDIELSGN